MTEAALFMKIGTHADERLDQIVARKKHEQQNCGVFFWGYGGVVCHPINQVQLFVEQANQYGEPPLLLMSITKSRFTGKLARANEYSVDGKKWQPLPPDASVRGSKYALICQDLEVSDLIINISNYKVAIGPSKGKNLSNYLRYRTDKACAVWEPSKHRENAIFFNVGFRAKLVQPYAVLLKT